MAGSATGGGSLQRGHPHLEPGQPGRRSHRTVTFQATVNAGVATGTVIANTASINCTEVPTAVTSTANVTVTPPALTLAKTAAPTSSAPGATITYTLAYGNTLAHMPTNVMLTDTLPASLSYVPARLRRREL